MTSFAELGLLLALVAPAAAVDSVSPVPAALEARVAAQVAALWVVPAEGVRLEWGAVQHSAALSDSTGFRLVGRGSDGWFAVVFDPESSAPIAARLHAGVTDTVLVIAQPVAAGDTVTAADLRAEEQVRWGAPARVQRISAAPGWIARRPLNAGDVLTAATAAPPPAVRAGQSVRLEWVRGAVIVAREGTALNDAAVGQPVRTRLAELRGPQFGVAAGAGIVRMDP